MARDYYEILGLQRSSSSDDIKKAYRKLAKQLHPDTNKDADAEAKFREVAEAYEVLNDDEKRSVYDRYGHAGLRQSAGGAGGFGFGGQYSGAVDLNEIFEEFFNGFNGAPRGARRGPRAGRDLQYVMRLTFEESIFGVEREIEYQRMETCQVCTGTGAEPGSKVTTCPTCKGTGEIRRTRQQFLMNMVEVAPCPTCNGTGKQVETPCHECRGAGQNRRTAKRTVNIPGGIDETRRFRVPGGGEPGDNNGPTGDLYITFKVQPHEYFRRQDNDILLDLKLNVAQAALGGTFQIPTVDGNETLTVSPGTQTGKIFTMAGKGAPILTSSGTSAGRGNQHVLVQVVVPTKLSAEQRTLFEELAKTMDAEVEPQKNGKGFWDNLKGFFNGE